MVRDRRGRYVSESTELPHGWQSYYRGCRCDVCRDGVRVHTAELRARKRGLAPVPPTKVIVQRDSRDLRAVPPAPNDAPPADQPRNDRDEVAPGPCEQAVLHDVARLGVASSNEALVAAARAMARILDDRRQVTTQPSACGKLMAVMDVLRRGADTRQGRLAAVQAMSQPSARGKPPDAG